MTHPLRQLALACAFALPAASPVAASHGALLCDAGAAYLAECDGGARSFALDGSRSRDPRGRPLTYAWTTDCPGAVIDHPDQPRPTLLLGPFAGCELSCEVTLEIANPAGTEDDCHATVAIIDTTPPPLAEDRRELFRLWPPNHRIACIDLAPFLPAPPPDVCGSPVAVRVLGCAGADTGCAATAEGLGICLPAERRGDERDGRRYDVVAEAVDACGNRSQPAVVGTVLVPHDERERNAGGL